MLSPSFKRRSGLGISDRRPVLRSFQVDVFAPRPFTGNGLGVFPEAASLSAGQMQSLTQELRQFECVFLVGEGEDAVRARIFTMEEELPFAGHPLLGAGAVLHHLSNAQAEFRSLLELAGGRRLEVRSSRSEDGFQVEMDQGVASFGAPLDAGAVLEALGLVAKDLDAGLPLQVVSTGLPYLLVPVRQALERARILERDFEGLLSSLGARFVYLLDVEAKEGRTWDNRGAVEDVATGSAAGPAGAYLVHHGRASPERWQRLAQGRFAGRPSEIAVHVTASGNVTVRGRVHLLGEGHWLRLPAL
jgi:trans-2,3-dihydro-3-hydroxyanthranilate isomerase